MVSTPATGLGERVRIMVVRLGRGLPIDSKVRRPMTTIWPVVIFLNHLKSSGRCQGILLPAPMTRLSDMAAIALKHFTGRACGNCFAQSTRRFGVALLYRAKRVECAQLAGAFETRQINLLTKAPASWAHSM